MIEDKTIFDLSDEETEDYENNPENWEEVTNNSIEDALNMMFPMEWMMIRCHKSFSQAVGSLG